MQIDRPIERDAVDKGKMPMQVPSQWISQLPPQSLVDKESARICTLDPQEGGYASSTATTGTLFIDKLQVRVLVDTGATHLFTKPYVINKLAREKTIIKVPLAIRTPLGETIEVRFVCPGCMVEIGKRVLPVNLIELTVFDFDVILRMD